jgi:mono/diheme cytochrome c family protein
MKHRGASIVLGGFVAGLCAIAAAVLPFGLPSAQAGEGGATNAIVERPVPDQIDFNRDVRPVLSDNCYACHGPDKNKRKADLRLDTKDGLMSSHDDVHTVVAGKPADSELFRRVTTDDPDERMPDPKSNKRLTPREIAILKKWIEQGAPYKGHWAFIKPVRPEVPAVDEPGFVRNPVDRFILARLKEEHLQHAPEADRVTLLRRVYFDLTGLPPTRDEVDAFVKDPSSDAYEKVVDKLLASPAFGERMAEYWLDLVRYADSIGYHSDNPMNVSPYREYVIQSFNTNKPFDRFTVEQLAGDLLPNPTLEQKVATAYNRLLQTTEEGGAQPKEYEQKYLADRVRNVSTVWMAATMGCCQCHDHKFDPFSQKDFYSMGAFFADVQEASVGKREPGMPVPDAKQAEELKKLDETLGAAKKKLEQETPELAAAQAEWEKNHDEAVRWTVLEPQSWQVSGESKLRKESDGVLRSYYKVAARETFTVTAKSDAKEITGFRLEALPDDELPDHGPGTAPNGNFVLTDFKVTALPAPAEGSDKPAGKPQPLKLAKATADHAQDGFPIANAIDGKPDTGWAILPQIGKSHEAVFEADKPVAGGDAGVTLTFTLAFNSPFPQHDIGKFRLSSTSTPHPAARAMPAAVKAALAVAPDDRNDSQKKEIAAYYRTIAPALDPVRAEVASVEKQKSDLLKAVPTCLVTTKGNPRTVRILARGNWQDESGKVVSPAVPDSLGRLDAGDRRLTRLDLANWLVSKDNPLTARVFVNRLWKLYFGQGLSKALDDFGAQGEWPTHPELLDWLAVEFMNPSAGFDDADSKQPGGWDVKHMVRLLVTSGTYRQGSKASPEQKERDPYNRLYARQSRFRLDAEMVRDNALAVSGLLVQKVGGPSVFPYQPPGYWFALNFPVREWKNDTGPGLYRRGLYTHWQRSFLHPSLLAFDAPSREEGVCERARSNIPQQALVLLNDPTYVEASRVLAERIVKEGGSDETSRIRWAVGQVLSRDATDEEVKVLSDLYLKHRTEYDAEPELAKQVLSVGEHKAPSDVSPTELAAWTSVARTILNLSETITRY